MRFLPALLLLTRVLLLPVVGRQEDLAICIAMVVLFTGEAGTSSATLKLAKRIQLIWELFLSACLALDVPALTAVITEAVIKSGMGTCTVLSPLLQLRRCRVRPHSLGIPPRLKQAEH